VAGVYVQRTQGWSKMRKGGGFNRRDRGAQIGGRRAAESVLGTTVGSKSAKIPASRPWGGSRGVKGIVEHGRELFHLTLSWGSFLLKRVSRTPRSVKGTREGCCRNDGARSPTARGWGQEQKFFHSKGVRPTRQPVEQSEAQGLGTPTPPPKKVDARRKGRFLKNWPAAPSKQSKIKKQVEVWGTQTGCRRARNRWDILEGKHPQLISFETSPVPGS